MTDGRMRWIVHIGNHKTGTSALQYLLWHNRARLRERGILYPESGRAGGVSHGQLAEGLKPTYHDPAGAARLRDALIGEAARSGCGTVLLSSEVLLEHPATAAAIREWLPADDDVEIVAYLRNQVDWIQSVMDEVVRNPYRRFTGEARDVREHRRGLYRYGTALAPWVSAFGTEAVTVRSYDRARRQPGLLADLLTILALDPRGFDASVPKEFGNVRLPPVLTEFLRRVNRLPMLNGERDAILAGLAHVAPRVPEFTPACSLIDRTFATELRDECAGVNEQLFTLHPPHEPTTLFEHVTEPGSQIPAAAAVLDGEVQARIMELLPEPARAAIERAAPRVRARPTGALPPAPRDREARLQEIVLRQRMEMRQLYAMLDEGTR